MPAAKRSLAYANSPVTLGMASTRRTLSPTRPSSSLRAGMLILSRSVGVSAQSARHTRVFPRHTERGWWYGVAPRCTRARDSYTRRQSHRVEDFCVPRAAAEVAGQGFANLVVRRLAGSRQQIGRRHDQPRRAEATLHRARL